MTAEELTCMTKSTQRPIPFRNSLRVPLTHNEELITKRLFSTWREVLQELCDHRIDALLLLLRRTLRLDRGLGRPLPNFRVVLAIQEVQDEGALLLDPRLALPTPTDMEPLPPTGTPIDAPTAVDPGFPSS
jgi:hypothetical protein